MCIIFEDLWKAMMIFIQKTFKFFRRWSFWMAIKIWRFHHNYNIKQEKFFLCEWIKSLKNGDSK